MGESRGKQPSPVTRLMIIYGRTSSSSQPSPGIRPA
jgi:hypothetical protein